MQANANDPFIFYMMGNTADLVARVGAAGIYYIDFHSGSTWGWPQGKTTQDYSVLVTTTDASDYNEPNDNKTTATVISVNQSVTGTQWRLVNTNQVWSDEDWYKMIVPFPGKLDITLNGWVGTFNWGIDYDRMYVYNEADEALSLGTYGSANDPFHNWMMSNPDNDELYFAQGGNYYLRYHSGNGYTTELYTLSTTFTTVNDIYEPNDDIQKAKDVNIGVEYSAYQWRSLDQTTNIRNDEDYYKLTIPAMGELTITVNDWTATVNWSADFDRMYLYDVAGNPLIGTGNDPYIGYMMYSKPYTKKVNIASAGIYYIRLHSGSGYSLTPYTVKFDFVDLTNVQEENGLSQKYELMQNYPNPFNPTTVIEYSIPESGNVLLTIFDLLGNEVKVLQQEHRNAGVHRVSWDGVNKKGVSMTSGIYIYSLKVNDYVSTRKMLLVK